MTLLVFLSFTGGAFGAHAVFGQDLDVKLFGFFCHSIVDAGDDVGQVHHFSGFFGQAEFAIEIPKVGTFRQIATALTLEVFANVVFDGFEQTVGVFAFDLKLECFFMKVLVGKTPEKDEKRERVKGEGCT